jgi:ankyrin repeat protein
VRVEALLNSVPEGELLPVIVVAAEQTALHLAVEFNAEPVIIAGLIRVLDMGQANAPDKFGNTPLHLCCRYGTHFEMLRLLSEAWPDAILQENRRKSTPFDDLFMRDEDVEDEDEPWDAVEATTVLLDACPKAVDYVDREGQTLLHRVLKRGATYEMVNDIPPLLLTKDPQLAHKLDYNMVAPLHEACKLEESILVVQDLMARSTREQWMAKDIEGRTALHCAIYWSASVDVVRELVQSCYELIHMQDISGKTPMDYLLSFYAPEFGNNLGWNSFLDNVVDRVQAFFVNGPHQDKTRNGSLFLHSALYTKDCPMPIIQFLVVAAPEQADEQDETGNLPLHLASAVDFDAAHEQSYVEVIVEMLERYPEGARAPNPKGLLPLNLMLSAGRTWECGIEKLVEVHPAAICDLKLPSPVLSEFLSKLDRHTMFRLLQEAPFILEG